MGACLVLRDVNEPVPCQVLVTVVPVVEVYAVISVMNFPSSVFLSSKHPCTNGGLPVLAGMSGSYFVSVVHANEEMCSLSI